MNKTIAGLAAAVLAAGLFGRLGIRPGQDAPKGKMVTMYQADKCHMYFTPPSTSSSRAHVPPATARCTRS